MSKNEINDLLAEANKNPSVDDLLTNIYGGNNVISKPTKTKKRKNFKKLKESFLNQIENYNDFLTQNDLEDEQINPSNDYDFSAFTSPKDWAAESERLSDRLSDRKIEIKQNEDAGEFTGMELEGGMPSYEAVQDMNEEQFKAYEAKYLTPTIVDTEVIPEEIPTIRPVADLVVDPIINSSDAVVVPTPTDTNDTNTSAAVTKVVKPKVKKVQLPKQQTPNGLDLKSLLINTIPYPTRFALDSALEAVNSGKKVMNQGQLLNALEDAGKGVMSGLADTTGDVLDVGGLLKNSIADEAHKSSKWWEDGYAIPDSEAGRIGSNIGSEAVTGLLGGVVGKAIGNGYKSLKLGGEKLRRDATKIAKDRQKFANDLVGTSTPIGKASTKDVAIVRQNTYENLTNQLPRKSLSTEPLTSALIHNAGRHMDKRAMLKYNDVELNTMFKEGIPLDDALKIQKARWDAVPNSVRDAGAILGVAVGQ